MTNLNYDVVVVGTGNAALSAALGASEEGLKVLMVQKGPKHKRGGNSFFTDGAIRMAYNNLQGLSKVVDNLSEEELESIELPKYSNDDYYGDIMKVTQNESDPVLANHLSLKSFETILWMKEKGVEFQLNENQFFERDGKKVFWGGLPIKTVKKGSGLSKHYSLKRKSAASTSGMNHLRSPLKRQAGGFQAATSTARNMVKCWWNAVR